MEWLESILKGICRNNIKCYEILDTTDNRYMMPHKRWNMLHLNQTLGIIVCGLYSASKALQLILQTFHRLPFLRLLPAALSISLQAETLLPFELPHSSTLAWRIPWTEEPGRLQSTGSRRVGHD